MSDAVLLAYAEAQISSLKEQRDAAEAERDTLRAELAAEKKHTQVWAAEAGRWEAKFNDARAELAAAKLVAKDNLDWFNALKPDYDKAVAERDSLREALLEALELIDFWGSYASEYFQEKHGLKEDLARIGAILPKE